MSEQPELIWEWGSMNVRGIKELPAYCGEYTNKGWMVFGIYPVKSKGLDLSANAYDVVFFRQRPLTDEEYAEREARREAAESSRAEAH